MDQLIQKLIRAGLPEIEANVYRFIYDNPACSPADACLGLSCSKSSVYRAFDSLKEQNLIYSDNDDWKQLFRVSTFEPLIDKLRKKQRKDKHIINYFRAIQMKKSLNIYDKDIYIESLSEEETYQKYLDLSEMSWDSILAFGNWEDLNSENRNLIPIEKTFIKNRLKKGARAYVSVSKRGPHTDEIVDLGVLDKEQARLTAQAKLPLYKPFWLSAFEGNSYVHIWNLDDSGKLASTFINSVSLSSFYKDLVYSNLC